MEEEDIQPDKEPFIVIVEDDNRVCALMQEAATYMSWHHRVKIMVNEDQLFDLLDSADHFFLLPSLIVLDYNLSVLGGETILVLLKKDKRYKHIPVVLYASFMSNAKESELLGFGASFCRPRPKTINAINHFMGELIGFIISQQNRTIQKGYLRS